MTAKQKEQIKLMEQLGFPTRNLNYEDLIDHLLNKYIMLSDACEWSEERKFAEELKRIQQPSN